MTIWHRTVSADIEHHIGNADVLGLLRQWREAAARATTPGAAKAAPAATPGVDAKVGAAVLPDIAEFQPAAWPGLQAHLMQLRADGADFRYVHYGSEVARIAGFDMTGRCVGDFGGELALFFLDCYRQALAHRAPLYAVHYSDRAATVFSWQRLILPLRDAAGTPWLLAHNAPLEQRHALLGQVLNATSDGVLGLRALRDERGALIDWTVVTLNDALAQLAGRALLNPVGRPVAQALLRWPDLHLHAHCVAVATDGQRQAFDRHIVVRGEQRDFAVEISALGDGCVIRLSDVTELRRHEQTLQRREQELRLANEQLRTAHALAEAANRAKSAFLATMSHEVRTPMNGVIGMAQLLQYETLAPQQAAMVRTIQESAQALLAVIDDVLAFSEIEAGRLTLQSQTLWPAQLAQSVCDALATTAQESGVQLRLHTVGAEVARRGDTTRLHQVLLKLLGNAIKFSGGRAERAGIVDLEVHALTDGVRFVVADNGVGIDDPMRERLFQPFVQADMSTTRRFGGTGLGLAICERLVHLMGGAIELSGASGQGTRLVVTLPLPPPLATEAGPDAAALPLAPRWPITAPKAARLLVAEDDRVNQKVVKHQLRALGYEADIADDGQAALQRWREGQYAMLLTDLFMPHLDGYELAAAIRREEAADAARGRLPIVMLTANAQADTGQRARAAGIDSVLTKPADLGLLRDTLQRWLRATPPAASSTAVLRLELLHELVGEHPLAVREVLRNFVPTAREMGAELRLALASGDVVHAGALAHKLTSASRAVGAVALGEFCARLQGQGDASDVVPAAISLRAFEQVLRQTLAAVEGHLSEAQP